MRRVIHVLLLGFAASVLILALTREPDASASVAYSSPYPFDQTYATTLRMLHVDMGFKILEKDKDLGYILFEYTSPESGNKVVSGSIELVETKSGTNVAVQVPAMPQYHEQMIVDSLSKKLSKEYGSPPARKKDDKDADKDKDKSKDGDKDKDKSKDGDKDKDKDGDKDKDKDGDKGKDDKSVSP
jgi:hypothetical protein